MFVCVCVCMYVCMYVCKRMRGKIAFCLTRQPLKLSGETNRKSNLSV